MQAPSNPAATLSATPVHRIARFPASTGHWSDCNSSSNVLRAHSHSDTGSKNLFTPAVAGGCIPFTCGPPGCCGIFGNPGRLAPASPS
uniref:Uncharacterized protein n=1 Tax=Arundo donax TaxID=35708 RepID=A0A0A9ETE8_ARUDO